MTSQQRADHLLTIWRQQARAGIKPQDRRLPDLDEYERDLDVLRRCMERK